MNLFSLMEVEAFKVTVLFCFLEKQLHKNLRAFFVTTE
jgi:hypothetical protein